MDLSLYVVLNIMWFIECVLVKHFQGEQSVLNYHHMNTHISYTHTVYEIKHTWMPHADLSNCCLKDDKGNNRLLWEEEQTHPDIARHQVTERDSKISSSVNKNGKWSNNATIISHALVNVGNPKQHPCSLLAHRRNICRFLTWKDNRETRNHGQMTNGAEQHDLFNLWSLYVKCVFFIDTENFIINALTTNSVKHINDFLLTYAFRFTECRIQFIYISKTDT